MLGLDPALVRQRRGPHNSDRRIGFASHPPGGFAPAPGFRRFANAVRDRCDHDYGDNDDGWISAAEADRTAASQHTRYLHMCQRRTGLSRSASARRRVLLSIRISNPAQVQTAAPRLRASRLHSAILIPPKGILRIAGARPLPFAAIVGLEGGAASIRQPQYANAIGLDGGARNIGQPQYATAIFTGFPMLIDLDAAIRLERHHVNERISERQERRRAIYEVVKVGPSARDI